MKNIRTYWREIILAVSMMMFSSYFTVVSFLRYTNFYAGRFDLGNMSQTVWNTLHGRIFQLTDPNGIETVSRLATHADYILVLLAPFYAIWSDPRMLLLIQVVVVALGAIFVYLLGIEVIKNKNFALLFALLYLLNPSVQRTWSTIFPHQKELFSISALCNPRSSHKRTSMVNTFVLWYLSYLDR
jgi:uncharacterized membrane protein